MAKKFRRLQHISTIPILAALLLTSNPAAIANRNVRDLSTPDSNTDIVQQIQDDITDSRLRNK